MQEKHLPPWKSNISKYNQIFLSWLGEIGHHISYDEYEFINALAKSIKPYPSEHSAKTNFLENKCEDKEENANINSTQNPIH